MNALVTFSGRAYDSLTKRTVDASTCVDRIFVFDDRWMMDQHEGYWHTNQWIFNATCRIQDEPTIYKHGFGWCSWKAHIIMEAFQYLQDGDVVLYLDADTFPIRDYSCLFDQCRKERGVMVFEEQASNLRFTKADVGAVMAVPVTDGGMACGRFSLWQKGAFLAKQMLAEWWAYSINPRCTLWDRSVLVKDQPEYYRNSTEQSVLTQLQRKYSLPLHRGPDLWGAPQPGETRDMDLYPEPLFEQQWCTGDRSDYSGSSYRNV